MMCCKCKRYVNAGEIIYFKKATTGLKFYYHRNCDEIEVITR